ncbi:MAG: sialate O-acetylesterase [Defluviitaleaceae bacterium]|nr:sialate O-acetylesterase [Defluviitaleaceae bacterium]
MVTLPSIFSNGMVVGKKARIWGTANAGHPLTVRFAGKDYTIAADANGRFVCEMENDFYGGPHELIVGNHTIHDVYIGRVWLCGGQSNMETPLRRTRPLLDACIKDDTRIRAFTAAKNFDFNQPAADAAGSWHIATGDFLDNLFAVPYFFAREILDTLRDDVPVGLLCVAAGGTPIEGWLPEEIVRDFPALYEKLETVRAPGYMERLSDEAVSAQAQWYAQLNEADELLDVTCGDDADGWHARALLDDTDLPHGAIWYRKKIVLPTAPVGASRLSLGRAQDSVKVRINGAEVISVDYQYPPCAGTVPEGLLRTGENEIHVRVVGSGQIPRFIPGKQYALTYTDTAGAAHRIALDGEWQCRISAEMPPIAASPWFYGYPCGVYNYMLAPVLGYAGGYSVDGVIFYQGESNTGRPAEYAALFARFVAHLRDCLGDVPVIFTQLANYIDPMSTGENWAQLREQQRQCLQIPNTAMAIAIDCGEYNDLHPQDKQTVGKRLARHALNMAYSLDLPAQGPTISHATRDDNAITLHFNHARGLWAKNGRPQIELVTAQGTTHHEHAVIAGQTLVVTIDPANIKKIRFGWTDNPPVTLYNAHNLPASPFEICICGDF